jgi:macrolide-specific efflux system membrane fusion protein
MEVIKMKVLKVLALVLSLAVLAGCASTPNNKLETAKVVIGNILASIPGTGIVEPRNRLEIKPPVAGRVESVLVSEGDLVKKGQILAWISSADRAALLDAARSKGPDEVKYWEDVYKPTPIMAPLDGFIILRSVEPGQSVTGADAILVMADHLIVKAQVDETDLASIKLNQKAEIILDAYPGNPISARVEHIAYESQIINNVTIYEVDVVPNFVPALLRSGMSATVNFYQMEKRDVLTLPSKAVKKVNGLSYAFTKNGSKIIAVQIKTGLENNDTTEIISGLSPEAEVIIPTAKIISSVLDPSRAPRFGPFGGH